MSAKGIERLIELIRVSEEFAEMYTRNPEIAVEGFDLTKEEIEALVKKEDKLLINQRIKIKNIDLVSHRRY